MLLLHALEPCSPHDLNISRKTIKNGRFELPKRIVDYWRWDWKYERDRKLFDELEKPIRKLLLHPHDIVSLDIPIWIHSEYEIYSQ